MTTITDEQTYACALGWVNEQRRQNGLPPLKELPDRELVEWLPRARAALTAAAQVGEPESSEFSCTNCNSIVDIEWTYCAWCGSTKDFIHTPSGAERVEPPLPAAEPTASLSADAWPRGQGQASPEQDKEVMPSETGGLHSTSLPDDKTPPGSAPTPLSRADDGWGLVAKQALEEICRHTDMRAGNGNDAVFAIAIRALKKLEEVS